MAPYILSFLLSEILLLAWVKTRDKHKHLSILFVFLAICVPCLLAALRDLSIGVDTGTYKTLYFDKALRFNSFFSYLETQNTSPELLFHAVTWISARFFSLEFMLFVFQLLVVGPVFLALNHSKDKRIVLIGILFYYLFAYNESLNMIRQSISLAFSILSISLLCAKRPRMSILNTIIAILFHNSAIVMVPILICVAMARRMNSKGKTFLSYVATASIFFGIFFMQEIMDLLNSALQIRAIEKYAGYAERFSSVGFNYPVFIIWLILTVLACLFVKHMKTRKEYYGYIYFGIIYLASFFANVIIHYSNRAFFYLGYPFILDFIPHLICEQKSIKTSKFLLAVIVAILCIYWLLTNEIWNYNHTMPYIIGACL